MRRWFLKLGLGVGALFATLVTPLSVAAEFSEGDPERGAEIYDRCKACHALARNRTGPKLCGVVGRPAGGVEGFVYSPAMTASGLVWNRDTLDRFLEDPLAMVPETTMGFPSRSKVMVTFSPAFMRPIIAVSSL